MTIPASQFVNVIPSVLSAGAPPLSMSGLIVTEDTSIPIGTVQSFASATAVSNWFGASSNQAALANVYFNGYNGATQLPGNLLFAQYNASNVAAYVRGGSVSALTLTQIQALSGTISIQVNGTTYTTGNINLSSATSFSNAATLITTALISVSAPATCTYDSLRTAFVITSNTTGSSSTIAFPTDSSLSPSLYLQAAQGAVISQGANATTAAALMNTVIGITTNWASFTTDWLPTLTVMEAFASWVTTQNNQFLYVPYDNNAAAESPNASGVIGTVTANYNGVCCVWNPSGLIAAFVMGTIASINFNATGGRITFAYKSGSGLSADITSQTVYQALVGNHYNAYVSVASATEAFTFFQNGQVSGTWAWLDSYVNQIYFNAAFKGALITFLSQVNSVPYNNAGYASIAAALQPVINQMLTFGAAVAGGTLSGSQAAEVNAATGVNAAQAIESNGYFLQITAPSASVQAARGSPTINYWYFDGESIQSITMGSIDVE
jgi:hypothetical protein